MTKGFSPRYAPGAMRTAAALLLTGVALPSAAGTAATSQTSPTPQTGTGDEIVVIGQRLFRDVRPERDLDAYGIESYGLSTIDELLNELNGELGFGDDTPLIVVDGERINSADQIGTLPVEALRNIQVLPRGSAVRLGGRSSQRVVNISLRKQVRSATFTAAYKKATDGGWAGKRGEAILATTDWAPCLPLFRCGRPPRRLSEASQVRRLGFFRRQGDVRGLAVLHRIGDRFT